VHTTGVKQRKTTPCMSFRSFVQSFGHLSCLSRHDKNMVYVFKQNVSMFTRHISPFT